MRSKNNARAAVNVVDARVKLLQKALEKPTVMLDARQKLTKQKDAREKIQERRLHSTPYDVSSCLLITQLPLIKMSCGKIEKSHLLKSLRLQ